MFTHFLSFLIDIACVISCVMLFCADLTCCYIYIPLMCVLKSLTFEALIMWFFICVFYCMHSMRPFRLAALLKISAGVICQCIWGYMKLFRQSPRAPLYNLLALLSITSSRFSLQSPRAPLYNLLALLSTISSRSSLQPHRGDDSEPSPRGRPDIYTLR